MRGGGRGHEYAAEYGVVRVSQGQSACVVVAVGSRNRGLHPRRRRGERRRAPLRRIRRRAASRCWGLEARAATTMGRGKQGAATGAPRNVNMGSSRATT